MSDVRDPATWKRIPPGVFDEQVERSAVKEPDAFKRLYAWRELHTLNDDALCRITLGDVRAILAYVDHLKTTTTAPTRGE